MRRFWRKHGLEILLLVLIVSWIVAGFWSYPRELAYGYWYDETLNLRSVYMPQYAAQREWDRRQKTKICYFIGPLCVIHLWYVRGYEKEEIK